MERLCDRVMGVASACRTSFDKHDITKRLGFKSTHNVSYALGMLFQRGKIRRVAAGCKNAHGLDSAPALYVRK